MKLSTVKAPTRFGLACFVMLFCIVAAESSVPEISSAVQSDRQSSDLTLKVLDHSNKRPIKDTAIEIYSDNGVRCVKAPCETNGVRWTGKTNSHGIVIVPAKIIQSSMTITATGYSRGKELNRGAKKVKKRYWVIQLEPD